MRHKSLVVALAVCLVLSMASFAFAASLSDVSGHWANTQIQKWLDKGLVSGYPDSTFKPDKPVSRAEFVAMLNKAFDKKDSGAKVDFKDVKESDWFYTGIAIAKSNGYISGYEDGTFRPNNPITRQEAASIVARLLNLSAATDKISFTDADSIADWAKDSVSAVVASKIMSGYPDGSYKATNQITRAEALVTLDRALGTNNVSTVVEEGISGQVTIDDKAAAGAVVRLFAKGGIEVLKEVTADKDGKYNIPIKAGTYDITATKDNYVIGAGEVSVEKGTVKDLALAEGAVLNGKITENSGNILKQAKIFFTSDQTFVATTDDSGNYKITVLPNKAYTVRSYNNNNTASGLVVIATGVQVGNAGTQAMTTIAAPYNIISSSSNGGGGSSGTLVYVTSIAPVSVTTTAGVAPVLPANVTANYSDGSSRTVAVTWDSIDASKYAVAGTFTVNGTVSGTAVKAVANITVNPAVNPVLDVTAKTYAECQTAGAEWVVNNFTGVDYIYVGQAGYDLSKLFNNTDATTTYSVSPSVANCTLAGSTLTVSAALASATEVKVTATKGTSTATINVVLGLSATNQPSGGELIVYTIKTATSGVLSANSYADCKAKGATWVVNNFSGANAIYIGQAGLDLSKLFKNTTATTTYSISPAVADCTITGSNLAVNAALSSATEVQLTATQATTTATINVVLGLSATNQPSGGELIVYSVK